jgi:predicted RNA-binding Zn-ribbon protein involved in translation (DUF1610 family)
VAAVRIDTTYTFEKVPLTSRKNLPCPKCGVKVRRQRTTYQTLNPYNKDRETGRPKTVGQIYKELELAAEEWKKLPELCFTCSKDES